MSRNANGFPTESTEVDPVDPTTPAPAAPTGERRRAPRRQPAMGTVLNLDGGDPDAPLRQGLVWNISTSGVSMLIPERVEPGTPMSGMLVTTDDAGRLTVRMRVAHICLLQTGDYFLGAQFDRPLTPDEMRPFVVADETRD